MSSIPADRLPSSETLWSFDKVIHAAEYFILGALVARAFHVGPPRLRAVYAFGLALAAAAVFGVADELYQTTTPGRSGNRYDAYADAAGAMLGALAVTFLHMRKADDGNRSELRK
jgi:VanZ family protein